MVTKKKVVYPTALVSPYFPPLIPIWVLLICILSKMLMLQITLAISFAAAVLLMMMMVAGGWWLPPKNLGQFIPNANSFNVFFSLDVNFPWLRELKCLVFFIASFVSLDHHLLFVSYSPPPTGGCSICGHKSRIILIRPEWITKEWKKQTFCSLFSCGGHWTRSTALKGWLPVRPPSSSTSTGWSC